MKENILITIFNYRHDDNARRWLNLLSPYFECAVLDSGNNKKCDDFIQFPNIYYSGLFNEMKKLSEKKDYEWVGVIPSDIEIDEENAKILLEKIPWLFLTRNIGIWQPSLDKDSRNWLGNLHSNTLKYEGKRFIEANIFFIRNSILKQSLYIDTQENTFGYGISEMISLLSLKNGYNNIFDNTIQVHHPKEIGYSNFQAIQESKRWTPKMAKYFGFDYSEMIRPKYNSFGEVNIEYKKHPIYVTFTSWKDRIKYLPQFVENIKKSKLKVDKYILWLSSDEISETEVPKEILGKIEIKWIDKNFKSFKKFLTIQEHPEAYNIIIDDDRLYNEDILQELYDFCISQGRNTVCCYYSDICNSKGQPWGETEHDITDYKWINNSCIIYPPYTFPQEAFKYFEKIMINEPLVSDECFIMPFLIHNKTKIASIKNGLIGLKELGVKAPPIKGTEDSALYKKFLDKSFDTKLNGKNELICRIISKLPIEYYEAYKLSFHNFKCNNMDVFNNNEILKKICQPADGILIPFYSKKERIIVTMTSWTKRIKNVKAVIDSILRNTTLPDLIVINLSVEEFPNREKDLPIELNNLIKEQNGLIEINWLKYNTKVWKKILPTLFKYPNDTTINVDDDFIYPNDFITTFKNKHKELPNKQLVGIGIKLWKGHNQHCGCASLDRMEWLGEYVYNITQECLDNLGDDDFYTYCLYANKVDSIFVGKKYFTNMQAINPIEGFSKSSHFLRSKINMVLDKLLNNNQNKETLTKNIIDSMNVSNIK